MWWPSLHKLWEPNFSNLMYRCFAKNSKARLGSLFGIQILSEKAGSKIFVNYVWDKYLAVPLVVLPPLSLRPSAAVRYSMR